MTLLTAILHLAMALNGSSQSIPLRRTDHSRQREHAAADTILSMVHPKKSCPPAATGVGPASQYHGASCSSSICCRWVTAAFDSDGCCLRQVPWPTATIFLPAGASNKAFMATHQESSTSTSWAMPAMSWVPDLATGSFGRDALLHIATGVGCTVVVVGAMFTSEQALLTNLRQLKRGSHAKAQ